MRHPRRSVRQSCPAKCPGCGRDPWAPGVTSCEPKDVRGRTSGPHVWPDEDYFSDQGPCSCGAAVGGFHHHECSIELCPWADTHPDEGEQLMYCGCFA